ncbi:MAG: DUF2339 domain-containing protein [Ferruginibacter sp.]
MEVLIFIALLIIIILLFNIKSRQKETAGNIHKSFLSLKKELLELKDSLNNIPGKAEPLQPHDEKVVQWRPYVPPEIVSPPVVNTPVELHREEKKEKVILPAAETWEAQPTPPTVNLSPDRATRVAAEGWWDNWVRNNPDLEKFIGENLINKIGITVLVLGIAFFVKYAIDQDWIKEAGRVSIGIGCGIVLTGLAHYLRNSYRSFSSVLAGGGIAVFYFTIAFGFHQYQLFTQTAAFVIMAFITVFAVTLSLIYDKLELAVIAAIGGFITPFLVSTGSGNYIVLFTYILMLNIGMLVLAYFKKWQAINVIALFFTICIYGGWLVQNTFSGNAFLLFKNSLLFASAFYLLFLGMGMIYNIRTRRRFTPFDFTLLMVTTSSYYAAGMVNLHYWNEGAYQGLFTIVLAAINFCLAGYLYKTGKGDKNLLYLLIGLTLTFTSLAAPVQLQGHTITLFWSAEFVLLYWLHQRSTIRVFKTSSFIIMVLLLISLMMDWSKANDFNGQHLVVLYKTLEGFITNVVAVIAFITYAMLLRKEKNTIVYVAGISNNAAATAMIIIAAFIFYLTCVFGINLYFYNYLVLDVPNTWHQLITYLFTALLLWIIRRYGVTINIAWRMILIAGCVVMYLVSIPYVSSLRNGALLSQYPSEQLWVHWMSALALLYLLYQAIALYRKNGQSFGTTGNIFVWVINSTLIFFFSIEAMHFYLYITAPLQTREASFQQYVKAGLTIIWALCSFTIMWMGMKHKFKTLRIISLVVFSFALVKLFLFDIRNISEGGKIAAFIMLGILLLIISFMYQKLKKIIIDDSTR